MYVRNTESFGKLDNSLGRSQKRKLSGSCLYWTRDYRALCSSYFVFLLPWYTANFGWDRDCKLMFWVAKETRLVWSPPVRETNPSPGIQIYTAIKQRRSTMQLCYTHIGTNYIDKNLKGSEQRRIIFMQVTCTECVRRIICSKDEI